MLTLYLKVPLNLICISQRTNSQGIFFLSIIQTNKTEGCIIFTTFSSNRRSPGLISTWALTWTFTTIPPIYLHWVFPILQFEISSLINWIFSPFWNIKLAKSKIPVWEIHFVGLGTDFLIDGRRIGLFRGAKNYDWVAGTWGSKLHPGGGFLDHDFL